MPYTVRILTLYGDVLVEPVGALDEALTLAGELDSDLGSTLAMVEVLDETGGRIAADADPQAGLTAVAFSDTGWRRSRSG